MTEELILQELERLATELSIGLRYEKGDFTGGFYRYKDRAQIVINQDLAVGQKIKILAHELRDKLDLEHCYLVPALREVIEDAGDLE